MSNTNDSYGVIISEYEPKLSIIYHNDSFFNTTKLVEILEELFDDHYEQFDSWIQHNDISKHIEYIEYTGVAPIYYQKTTPDKFAGTYVHNLLFCQYIISLGTPHTIIILIALDKHNRFSYRNSVESNLLSLTKSIRDPINHIKNSNIRELQMQITIGEIQEYLQDLIKLSNKTIKYAIILFIITWSPFVYILLFDQ